MRLFWLINILFISFVTVTAQNTLTLEDAIKNAVENNFNIKIAKNALAVQVANNTSGNAGMLPTVALNFGQTFNVNNTRLELASGEVREGKGANTRNLNANIQANWTIFDGMLMFVTKDRLKEIENLGAINLQLQIENTTYEVMAAYYNIEQQIKRIETIRQAIAISNERLELATLKKDAGTGSGIPVLQAEVDINADSSVLLNQELILKNMKININRIMAVQLTNDFNVVNSEDIFIASLEEVNAAAERRNKQLLMADKDIEISKLVVKQWESNRYPSLDINTGYNFSQLNAEIGLIKFNQNAGFNFGLTGRWNIFNGWNNKREIQVAKLNLETENLSKQNLKLQLDAEILTIYNQYLNALQMKMQEDKNISVAQQSLSITSEKMRLGTINDLEFRQAQLNLTDAKFRRIVADFNAKMAVLELKRLSGSLLP